MKTKTKLMIDLTDLGTWAKLAMGGLFILGTLFGDNKSITKNKKNKSYTFGTKLGNIRVGKKFTFANSTKEYQRVEPNPMLGSVVNPFLESTVPYVDPDTGVIGFASKDTRVRTVK